VDSTGVGDPVLEALQTRGRAVGGQFEGFKFSATSKQQLMEGLAVAIQQQQIHFPAGVIVDELEAFEYEYTRTGVHYSAPSGFHDDAVCALALARSATSHPPRGRVSRPARYTRSTARGAPLLVHSTRARAHEWCPNGSKVVLVAVP
jgi:hypothetical protein